MKIRLQSQRSYWLEGGPLHNHTFEATHNWHPFRPRQCLSSSYKQTMSLAARLTMQQTAARLFLRPTQSQSTLAIRRIVARTFSTSPARLYAEHAHNHSHSVASASSSSDNYVNPYKGQSALDKAVHLFFFTEILRGKLKIMHSGPVSNLDIFLDSRHVDCHGTDFPTSIHHYVSI